jgi:hypothetical protein
MSRRIKYVPAYHASVAALPQTPEVWSVIDALIARVTARPEVAELLSGTNARAVYSLRMPRYPSLCLFYSIDATTIYLLHVGELDDLPDDE